MKWGDNPISFLEENSDNINSRRVASYLRVTQKKRG